MPPNFKFPTAAQLALVNDEQDLIDAVSQRRFDTRGSSIAPSPLTLGTNTAEENGDFIFHDMEANSHLDAATMQSSHFQRMHRFFVKIVSTSIWSNSYGRRQRLEILVAAVVRR